MNRWIFAIAIVGGVAAVVPSCKVSTGSSPGDDSSGDDDASADGGDGAACTCAISPEGGGQVTLACGSQPVCIGSTNYLCAGGTTMPISECGFTDGGPTLPDACVPSCGAACDIHDGCGGICQCSATQQCVDFTCVAVNPNCQLQLGDYCNVIDSDASADCCGAGYQCAAVDGGAGKCCAVTGGGICNAATDCCSYPSVLCAMDVDSGVRNICRQ
jgi:hypothetical protein